MRNPFKITDSNNCWYKDGIRFSCIGCGRCCKSEDGSEACVYLNGDDIKDIASFLNLTVEEFKKNWTEIRHGKIVIKDPKKDCPFLKNNRCIIYPVRPLQCKTWPFWEICLVEKNWEKRVASSCPGVGNGKLYSKEEIENISKKSPL